MHDPTPIEPDFFLSSIERDGAVFLSSCLDADPAARVLACPEWTASDLLWHLTEVHWFWRSIVEQRATRPDAVGELARPDDGALPERYRTGLVDLVTALRAAELTTPVWTWSDDQTVAFVARRMAQETAVHRWDADHLAGRPSPIEPTLASDGIDEFLTHFLEGPAVEASTGEGAAGATFGSVHIHCTDGAGEWTSRMVDGAWTTTREHAKGDAAMRGPASDLLLALWRRVPLDVVDVVGDRAVAEAFVRQSRLE